MESVAPSETPHNNQDVPAHIGVIMDGNGRWAKERRLPRREGHMAGLTAVKRMLRYLVAQQVQYVTIYVFSTENWKRPRSEVSFILNMVGGKLREHYPFYKEHGIRVVHSGALETLGKKLQRELHHVVEDTQQYSNLTLNIAFNYGGRDEIVRAFQRYVAHGSAHNTSPLPLTEDTLAQFLDQPAIPFPDLIIRTGKQKRLSNFLLWQSAYAELYFSDLLWPDWDEKAMEDALMFYRTQKRNFGGIDARQFT